MVFAKTPAAAVSPDISESAVHHFLIVSPWLQQGLACHAPVSVMSLYVLRTPLEHCGVCFWGVMCFESTV